MKCRWVVVLFVGMSSYGAVAQGTWSALFNGRDLTGWEEVNGQAPFTVQEGTIVGRTIVGSPNSFLCTKETYGDFILELEFKVGAGLNSGIQIRSESTPSYLDGRVHGYQVEIDPSDRAWSAGIYDESRRGWLCTLEQNPRGRAAFKPGAWNAVRVEAFGPKIRTWLNGVPCSRLLDDMTPRGFIALQVHSIGSDSTHAGMMVAWRNVRITTVGVEKALSNDDASVREENFTPNAVSQDEVKEGWKLLWDGRTTSGWTGAKIDRFPDHGWSVENGELAVQPSGGAESTNGGDIVTTAKYRNFELSVDFKITEGANSGIKYFVDPGLNKGEGSAIGCEFQVLDDERHPDAKLGVDGNRTLAGLYDLIPPVGVRPNPIGQWNRARIIVKGSHVEHWLNGFKTVEYERGTQEWRALVSHSKFRVWPKFGEAAEGNILLQDHGNAVAFRSIKIHVLP